jgi:hypothetical protein
MANISVPWSTVRNLIGDVTSGLGEGQTVTLRRPSANEAIAGEPWEGPAESTSSDTFSSVPAVVIPEESMEREGIGTDIAVRKVRCTIAGIHLSEEPQVGWILVNDKDGIEYKVTKAKTIRPGADTLVYSLEASR